MKKTSSKVVTYMVTEERMQVQWNRTNDGPSRNLILMVTDENGFIETLRIPISQVGNAMDVLYKAKEEQVV